MSTNENRELAQGQTATVTTDFGQMVVKATNTGILVKAVKGTLVFIKAGATEAMIIVKPKGL